MGVMKRLNTMRLMGVSGRGRIFAGVQITGDIELDRELRSMPDQLRDKHLRQASAAIIRYIVQPKVKAALNGPIGTKTGNLRKAIKNYGPRNRKDWPVAWKLKVDAPHTQLLEFGTEERFTKTGARRGRIEPGKFAFLRKAFYGSEAEAKAAFIKVLRAFIAELSTKATVARRALR